MHTTLDDEFIQYSGKTIDHSHLPNPAEPEIGSLREKLRDRAEKELLSLQETAEQEVLKALLLSEALAVFALVTDLGISS